MERRSPNTLSASRPGASSHDRNAATNELLRQEGHRRHSPSRPRSFPRSAAARAAMSCPVNRDDLQRLASFSCGKQASAANCR
ncbi:MAG: hypothetical protein ACLUEU_01100 [Oscillospiraceae bacterium]